MLGTTTRAAVAALFVFLAAFAAAAPIRTRTGSTGLTARADPPARLPRAASSSDYTSPCLDDVRFGGKFDAGWGACPTYSPTYAGSGYHNFDWCRHDEAHGVYAFQACAECGVCTPTTTTATTTTTAPPLPDGWSFAAAVKEAAAAGMSSTTTFPTNPTFEFSAINECADKAAHPVDVTFVATLNVGSVAAVAAGLAELVAVLPAQPGSPATEFKAMLEDAAAGLVAGLGAADDAFEGLELKLFARPLHGLLKAEATVPDLGMKLTAVVQASFIEVLAAAALGGAAAPCAMTPTPTSPLTGMKVQQDKDGKLSQDQDFKAWNKWVAVAFTLTPDSADEDTDEPGLKDFVLEMLDDHLAISEEDRAPFEYALNVLDSVRFGVAVGFGAEVVNLGGLFALPAPFDSGATLGAGLTIKATIDQTALPPRNDPDDAPADQSALQCNTVCEMMHDALDDVAASDDKPARLALVGNVGITTTDLTDPDATLGVSVKLSMQTENFALKLTDSLTLKDISFEVGVEATPPDVEGAIAVEGAVDWVNGDDTIKFTGKLKAGGGVKNGKPTAGVDFDFKMEGMYMNAYGTEIFHFGDLRLGAAVTVAKPYVERVTLGGRACLGGEDACVKCLSDSADEGACKAAIAMTGYANAGAFDPYIYAHVDGDDLSIGNVVETIAPSVEFPAWLNPVTITAAPGTMVYSEETRRYEMADATVGATVSFALQATSLPVTAADGTQTGSIDIEKGLKISGGVTLFADVDEIDWTASIEASVGDAFSMFTGSDWSITLACDPIEIKVGDVPILSLAATADSGRDGPVLQLSNKMEVVNKYAYGGVSITYQAIDISTELAELAVNGVKSGGASLAKDAPQAVFDALIGHNDFYGEMDATIGLFGAELGARFVVQLGKLRAFVETSVFGVFDAQLLVDIELPNPLSSKTYQSATSMSKASVKVQGFVDAPGLAGVQDAVAAEMKGAATTASKALADASGELERLSSEYTTKTLPAIKAELASWKLRHDELTELKATKDGLIDNAVAAVQAAQRAVNDGLAEWKRLSDSKYAILSDFCAELDTETTFSQGSTAGCIEKRPPCEINECDFPNSCPNVAKTCEVKAPCRRRRSAEGYERVPEDEYDHETHLDTWNAEPTGQRRHLNFFEEAADFFEDVGGCISGFFTETVTSGAKCGWEVTTGTAECGWKYTTAGAECGVRKIADPVLCASHATASCFGTFSGDVLEYMTNPSIFCGDLAKGQSKLDEQLSNAAADYSNTLLDLATAEKTVAELKRAANDAIDGLGRLHTELNGIAAEAAALGVEVIKAAEDVAKDCAGAAAAAAEIIGDANAGFKLEELFINTVLTTEAGVLSDISFSVFGAQVAVPSFSFDFGTKVEAGVTDTAELMAGLVAKLAAAAAAKAGDVFEGAGEALIAKLNLDGPASDAIQARNGLVKEVGDLDNVLAAEVAAAQKTRHAL